jgi:hypothetical protein
VEIDLAPTQPFTEPHERERGERGGAWGREESSSNELPKSTCVQLSSKGAPFIGGGGRAYPSTKAS